jgi:hypothetical protein
MEDNQQNPVEESTVEEIQETTPQEETETPEKKQEHTEAEKRLYARAKSAEEIAQKAKSEADALKKELAKAKLPISDVDAILEVQSATAGFDSDEVAELRLRAGALGTSLSKAREDKNFQLWQRGHREEIEKNKALSPNTNQDEIEKPKTLEEKLQAATTQDEKGKILDEYGINPMKARNY